MRKQEREYKSSEFWVKKLDDDQGVVEAIVAVFGNIDYQGDIIEPGAFARTIDHRGLQVQVLDNHRAERARDIVGKIIALREIGRDELPGELLEKHPEASGGLFAKIQFLMGEDTPEGRGIFARIKAGAIREYSIGYDALDTVEDKVQVADREIDVRRLREIRLWEISPVIFAANDATRTVSAKGELGTELAAAEPRLREIAQAVAKLNPLLGDADFLHQSLITGIDRTSPLILENLGFAVSFSGDLTPEERKRLLLNAVLEAGPNLIKQANAPTEGKPWNIFKQGDEWCVYRVNEDGERIGNSLGCHPTRAQAEYHMRALYANADEDEKGEPLNPEEMKPYPNEHACRLKDPEQYDTCRSGTRTAKEPEGVAGKEYRVIYCKTGDGPMEQQAFRYPTKTWTAAEARGHCRFNEGQFEAAREEDGKATEQDIELKDLIHEIVKEEIAQALTASANSTGSELDDDLPPTSAKEFGPGATPLTPELSDIEQALLDLDMLALRALEVSDGLLRKDRRVEAALQGR